MWGCLAAQIVIALTGAIVGIVGLDEGQLNTFGLRRARADVRHRRQRDKADQPTSFAFIDQYRKEYFRPGLLKEMAELGDLPPAPKAPAPKPAMLVPGVEENGALLTARWRRVPPSQEVV